LKAILKFGLFGRESGWCQQLLSCSCYSETCDVTRQGIYL